MKMKFVNMAAMNAAMLFASCSPVDASGPGTPAFDATVDVYEYAPSVVPSIEWSVKVDGEEAFVLPTTEHDVCVFGCDKPVTVVVNSLGGVYNLLKSFLYQSLTITV